ncbi:MAG: hypothetical protein JO102_04065 [Elusimicrobia bacterium]|nr:hypothetical protein [Elusimicrobiota bacterium]
MKRLAALLTIALLLASPVRAFEDTLLVHGGFWNWRAYKTMRYEVQGWPFSKNAASRRDLHTVDLDTGRIRIDGERVPYHLGFDGKQAWVSPTADAVAAPARFYTLAPFQFIGMPFVLAEPGVEQKDLGYRWVDGKWYEVYQFHYLNGADTPSDTFTAYVDNETRMLHLVYYDVTFPGLANPVRHAVVFDEWQTVDGLTVPKTLSIREWVNDKLGGHPGNLKATFVVSHVHFDNAAAAPAAFAAPSF